MTVSNLSHKHQRSLRYSICKRLMDVLHNTCKRGDKHKYRVFYLYSPFIYLCKSLNTWELHTHTHTHTLCQIMMRPKLCGASKLSFESCCLGLRGRGQRSGEGLAWQQTLTCYCCKDLGRLGKLCVHLFLSAGGSLTCESVFVVWSVWKWRNNDMFGIPRAASQRQFTASARQL